MKLTRILGILVPFAVTLSLADDPMYQEPSIPSCPHEWTLGAMVNFYQYREKYEGQVPMELKGAMLGGIFEYVYRTCQSFIFGVDADFSGGLVNYKSSGTGRIKNIGQNKFESRIKVGKRFPMESGFTLTPYIGLGVRFKLDYSAGRRSSTNHYGYNRSSFYLYIPMGGKLKKELNSQWAVEAFGEFDFFLLGKNKSHVSSGGRGMLHTQKKGFGVRGGIDVIRYMEDRNALSFGPFMNYWNIKDSNRIKVRVGPPIAEPHNQTVEAGLALRYHF